MKRTPSTPRGRRALDAVPALEAVIRAWTEEGADPAWHRARRRELHQGMPLLARALDRLVVEHAVLAEVAAAADAVKADAEGEELRQALPRWHRALEARMPTARIAAVPAAAPPRHLPRVDHLGPWLNDEEVAAVFGTSRQQVREWTLRGLLHASRTTGGTPVYARPDVAELLEERTHRGGENA